MRVAAKTRLAAATDTAVTEPSVRLLPRPATPPATVFIAGFAVPRERTVGTAFGRWSDQCEHAHEYMSNSTYPIADRPDDTAPVHGVLEPSVSRADSRSGDLDLDLWIAIAAGEAAWADADERPHPMARAAAGMELLALAAGVSLAWTGYLMRNTADGFAQFAPWLASGAILSLAIRPMRLLLEVRRAVKLWASVLVRSILVTAALIGLLPNSPAYGALTTWPLAVALGIEAALASWELGITVRPTTWWKQFVLSPLHLGILGAMVAVFVNFGATDERGVAIVLYVLVHLYVFIGALTAGAFDYVRLRFDDREMWAAKLAASSEHRRSAHWLHDDVSAQLKLVQLRLRRGDLDADETADALQELDHQLRLRQLDELYQSGSVRVAEVLQPFLRSAQGHGIELHAVPTFDDAALMLDERTGRTFGRAAAIITNNAIVAGATRLSVQVSSDDDHIELIVTDDAGGFDVDALPPGRALWQLGQELGTGRIESTPIDGGTQVTVVIPLTERRGRVEDPHR